MLTNYSGTDIKVEVANFFAVDTFLDQDDVTVTVCNRAIHT